MRGSILCCCAVALAGCEPELVYMCRSDAACDTAPMGQCVQGYCAFPDPACGGLKWDSSAGPLAGTCVPVAQDAAVDATARDLGVSDGAIDAAMPDMTHVLTWSPQTSGTGVGLWDVWGSGPNDIYVVGDSGTILHSSNGTSWFAFNNSPTAGSLRSVWGSSPNDVYIIGDGGGVWRTADQGSSWTTQTSGVTQELDRVWGSSGGNIFIAGWGGVLLRSTNSGVTWTPLSTGTTRTLTCVWGTGANDVYAVGAAGTIIHSNGGAWMAQPGGMIGLTSVWGFSSNDLFATGAVPLFGTALLRSNGQGTWTDITAELGGGGIYRLWGSGQELFGVQTSVVYHSSDDGKSWDQQPSNAPDLVLGIWGASTTNIYAVGAQGAIIHGQ
jgi:photosystem II stability/assembly factor-like uncharacterized protein